MHYATQLFITLCCGFTVIESSKALGPSLMECGWFIFWLGGILQMVGFLVCTLYKLVLVKIEFGHKANGPAIVELL